jgi:hypothetical protein
VDPQRGSGTAGRPGRSTPCAHTVVQCGSPGSPRRAKSQHQRRARSR